MKHRGEIADKAIRESGYTFTFVSERMGHTRNTLYNKLEEAELSYEYIIKLYKVIKKDPLLDFPELEKSFLQDYKDTLESAQLNSENKWKKEYENCQEQLKVLTQKYIEVLEENRTLRNRQTG